MARVARTDEFKRQVVKDRLRGIPVKALCEKYSIWPPMISKWMKEYQGDPELTKSYKKYDLIKRRYKPRATTLLAPTPQRALMELDASDKCSMTEMHRLLRQHHELRLLYSRELKRFLVFDDLTSLSGGGDVSGCN